VSAEAVAEILGRALRERAFAELLRTEPDRALAGYDLTPDERAAIAHGPDDGHGPASVERLTAVYDVPVQLSAVLGKASLPVNQLLRLGRGAVVELDRKVGEPVDIYVNNRLVARGEVVIVDERLGVTMTEIIKSEDA
jgi:flagellar motor switch protein FliN/FliY